MQSRRWKKMIIIYKIFQNNLYLRCVSLLEFCSNNIQTKNISRLEREVHIKRRFFKLSFSSRSSFEVHILKCRIILSGLTLLLLPTGIGGSPSSPCSWLTRGWCSWCGGRRWGRRWGWRGTSRGCCGRSCGCLGRTLLTRNSGRNKTIFFLIYQFHEKKNNSCIMTQKLALLLHCWRQTLIENCQLIVKNPTYNAENISNC